MNGISLIRDSSFLKELDVNNIKVYYIKILILDKDEQPLKVIQGRISTGSISIDGGSSVRRSGSLNFLAEEKENDLTDVDNLLSSNKKIKILVGVENNINENYEKIIWFNQGIFVIAKPNITHNMQGVNISLNFKDKMCLLNGECGGNLPTSITFSEYEQQIGYEIIEYNNLIVYPDEPNPNLIYGFKEKSSDKINSYMMYDITSGWNPADPKLIGTTITRPQCLYNIIQTLVCNYGGESIDKIIINDVPLQIKNSVRFTGSNYLYYNTDTGVYTLDKNSAANSEGEWKVFSYNEDCGYVYTDFTYPGELVSSIGDNVCSILDKIISVLGNYEYFYDIEGNFVFQEIKNYLNTQYDPIQKLNTDGFLLDNNNYYVDFSNVSRSIYTFEEGSALISSYNNSPDYLNLKNDYHIWGKSQDGFSIHYHLVIKEKPVEPFQSRRVVDDIVNGQYTGKIKLDTSNSEEGYDYTPTDWRAELYLRGLEKKSLQKRPDIYEQEILDLFDSIYNMKKKEFKTDIINHPNDLTYWIDFIEPYGSLHDVAVDTVGLKIYSYQQDNIKRLYDSDIPNVILINTNDTAVARASLISKCEATGQPYVNVNDNIYKNLTIGQIGYSAQEVTRNLMYQYTEYTASISITSIPIYYLEVNSRITVYDRAAGIFGDYIIKSINMPLDAKGTMTISAIKALERI